LRIQFGLVHELSTVHFQEASARIYSVIGLHVEQTTGSFDERPSNFVDAGHHPAAEWQ